VAAAQLARFGIFAEDPPEPVATRVAAAAAAEAPEPPVDATPKAPEVSAAPGPPDRAAAPVAAPPADTRRGAPTHLASLRDMVLLPDFAGLSVVEVTRITESARLIARVQGTGRAIRQDPPPGTIVPAGGIVTIEFGSPRADTSTPGGRS
jgi:hypothetical protein